MQQNLKNPKQNHVEQNNTFGSYLSNQHKIIHEPVIIQGQPFKTASRVYYPQNFQNTISNIHNNNFIQNRNGGNYMPVTMKNNPLSRQASRISYQNIAHSVVQPHFNPSPPVSSIINQNRQPTIIRFNSKIQPLSTNYHPRPTIIDRNNNIQYYRTNVSPINNKIYPAILNNNQSNFPVRNQIPTDANMQRYEALRWQNKYEDLKGKYFQLLSIVEKNSHVQDTWILEEENRLLREKIKVLEDREEKNYQEITQRIQKMIQFHKNTTSQECQLLIDRFRLQNKFLEKI